MPLWHTAAARATKEEGINKGKGSHRHLGGIKSFVEGYLFLGILHCCLREQLQARLAAP